MKKVILLIIGLALFSGLLYSQGKELKVLFVGNSYTYGYNLAHIVSIISEGTSTRLITRKSTIGGASLQEHWRGGRELETKEIIADGEFDKASETAHSKLGLTEEMKEMCSMFNNNDFSALGLAFHESGDALGDVLTTRDTNKSLNALNTTLGFCVQCHAAFRQ